MDHKGGHVACLDIPPGYLESVMVQAYYVDITLVVEEATFSGLVRILVDIKSGPARRVFYLHAEGLQLSAASVNDVPAVVVQSSVTSIEVPEEAAVDGGASAIIEVQFAGSISKLRTDGLYMRDTAVDQMLGAEKAGGFGVEGDKREVQGQGGGRDAATGGQEGKGPTAASDPIAVSGVAGNTVSSSSSSSSSTQPVISPRVVLGTHLEPTHARGLVPCVDLPRAKAVFHLTLRGVPRHLQAISNTPVLRTEEEESTTATTNDGTCRCAVKSVVFHPTPVMPTYVFGFWVGDFHCVSTRALATATVRSSDISLPPPAALLEEKSVIQINVHILKEVGLEGAEFALDFARRAFEFFSRLFPAPFPIRKLDLIGLPQMHGLGMENFGAITCLQEYLLVDANTSFVRRRRIARLVCHEISHMWYGDLVTPESFDDLWLKEGMARFFEYIAVDALDSSYHVWNNFMSEVFFQAMLADSQENSHPVVQQHNGDIASILGSFDTITYCKGASVLRMLSYCVGLDRFLQAMGEFVVSHQYGCATREDLWKAVQDVCDRDGVALNVRDLMKPWLTRPKFPVLRVRMAGSILSVTQHPFSFFALPEAAKGENSGAACWVIPLRIRTSSRALPEGAVCAVEGREGQRGAASKERLGEEIHALLLSERSTSVNLRGLCREPTDMSAGRVRDAENGGGSQEGVAERRPFLVVNDGHSGFFTVQYECERSWSLALAAVEEGVLSECETMGFVHDLVLALHEGVLLDRRAACLRILSVCGAKSSGRDGRGGAVVGQLNCDVSCLFSRLQEVVNLLGHGRGHPAWSSGQLFIWELLIMCAFHALGEIYELSRKRREFVLSQKLRLDNLERTEVVRRAPAVAMVTERVAGAVGGDHGGETVLEHSMEKENDPGSRSRAHQHRGGSDYRAAGVHEDSIPAAATVARSATNDEFTAAKERLHTITPDIELAFAEADEHAQWYANRVASGEEQAGEGLQSLRAMRDRLEESRAELMWAQQNVLLEALV